jgi:hypothetical protein
VTGQAEDLKILRGVVVVVEVLVVESEIEPTSARLAGFLLLHLAIGAAIYAAFPKVVIRTSDYYRGLPPQGKGQFDRLRHRFLRNTRPT